ncbi:MAG: tetratricopeptide repeat protein [Parvularculaceae bacterium]|jgi:hypothetical protein|nr:tetratricopeptide repeat protein [Parvularculaceae bacterium]
MSVRDAYDLPMSAADDAVGAGYDAYVREFLSYGSKLRALFEIADAAPQSAFLNAHAAALHLAFEGAEGWAAALPYLERMSSRRGSALAREALFCDAVAAWARRDFAAALAALDELTVRWPADLCAIKWGQYHAFNLGDQAALLRFGERARLVHEETPYAQGMIAFALEQNHRLAEAEEAGMRAVEIALDDAWAQHAVAHVYETERRPRDGARWLDHCAHTWEKKGVFIRDHNWWHAALFRLGLGRPEEALAIYDARLWGAWPEFPQEQIGAASMLWRLELRGVDVGARWKPLAAQARGRANEHLFPFHDLHYLLALARGGEPGEARAFLKSMPREGGAWSIAALAGEGMLHYARGEPTEAASCLAAAAPRLSCIGGSHAQRHLFAETMAAAAPARPARASSP